ncbi:MATE family efflux transporter [Clostridium sp. MSJ-4]|uniref:MATE family efflux transporter n=1 Tax=Clostridium simiarum TaxID=2841506 RepID=A0ABS6EW56_9CLOT|nr:MATE family efflux transporter [Clostridium simiarum]MBU5590457.1 MATE family efflux transporter [Clostridium simiarum]
MIDISKDKKFYKMLVTLALPIIMQNLVSSSLNMVDTLMIGSLGESSIAAVGLANQVFFLFTLIMFGINSGSGIFIAQYYGKKDKENIHRVIGIGLMCVIIIGSIFTVAAVAFPSDILRIFTKDSVVINSGRGYLRIVGLSYIINAITLCYAFALRCTRQPKIPMFISIIALVSNTILNIIFIYGKLGVPAMGVNGAAIATLISRIIEFILMIAIVYRGKNIVAGKIKNMLDLSKGFMVNFFKVTLPVIFNETFWALGMTMYSMAYARISTEAVASVQIATTVQNIFMVINMGIANAAAVMIGNKIGEREEEEAIRYSKLFSVLSPTVGIVMGTLLIVLAPLILKLFNVSPTTYSDSIKVLRVIGLILPIKFFNSLLVVGILRAGGDTKFSLFLETGSVWLIGVPLSFIGALVLHLPVYGVVALIFIEEIVKSSIGLPRVLSKKWVKNVVDM